ncbi:hypothetical protein [Hahella ganghwensis]|uniref:HzsA-related protein n=1 Tax=Hahella ganghwensis TaxID=286420 RepID=UPI0003A30D22|nr:hypothetical protein [Hahella ganghwensis]
MKAGLENDICSIGEEGRPIGKTVLIGLICSVITGCGGGGIGSSGQGADPVVEDFPIAYVKREIPTDEDGEIVRDDVRDPLEFKPGARLFVRGQASPSAEERHVTAGVFPAAEFANEDGQVLFDIKDLSTSYDGTKLLFSMRAPEIEDADDDEQPTWNIWEYDHTAGTLRRVITSDNTAEDGQDLAPQYLADGRIVFSSTRQRQSQAILLDEGKPQYPALNEANNEPALNLHVMESDGSDIHQITFNQSSDLDPILLENGKILFTRWNRGPGNDAMDLYQVNPDGTELEIVYGHHSHETGTDDSDVHFIKPLEMEDGRIMVSLRPYVATDFGADLVAVDISGYTDNTQPIYSNLGAVSEAQESLTSEDILTGEGVNLAGRYAFAAPLLDGTGRLVVSWSQCRLVLAQEDDVEVPDPDPVIYPCTQERIDSGDYEAATPLYGLWILNPQTGTQLPIVQPEEGVMYSDAVIMQDLPLPTYIPDVVAGVDVDEELFNEGYGIVDIRSVYDIDGSDSTDVGLSVMSNPTMTPASAREARFIRLEKPVSRADRDVIDVPGSAFGRAGSLRMREILGYVPVEPDGSARFKVPANVAFAISILNGDGKRISSQHHNWLEVKPGEELECVGCHTSTSELPHGRAGSQAPTINEGAPTTGLGFAGADTTLTADMGETMAQTLTRIVESAREPTPDINFVDDWAPAGSKEADFSYAYADLETAAPISENCSDNWTSSCRIVINYETHIHPMWSLVRPDSDGDLVADTCTSCHTDTDAMSATMIPAAQLDLTDGASDQEDDHFKAYRELLFTDAELEIDMDSGNLQDVLVPVLDAEGNQVYETDADGNLVLDADDNPIPLMTTVAVAPSLRAGNALQSGDFFDLFASGGSHEGYLSSAELKLLSEWVDIGAQYYNNPFDIPQD